MTDVAVRIQLEGGSDAKRAFEELSRAIDSSRVAIGDLSRSTDQAANSSTFAAQQFEVWKNAQKEVTEQSRIARQELAEASKTFSIGPDEFERQIKAIKALEAVPAVFHNVRAATDDASKALNKTTEESIALSAALGSAAPAAFQRAGVGLVAIAGGTAAVSTALTVARRSTGDFYTATSNLERLRSLGINTTEREIQGLARELAARVSTTSAVAAQHKEYLIESAARTTNLASLPFLISAKERLAHAENVVTEATKQGRQVLANRFTEEKNIAFSQVQMYEQKTISAIKSQSAWETGQAAELAAADATTNALKRQAEKGEILAYVKQKLIPIVTTLAAAFSAYKLASLIQESTMLAARHEELGIVMRVVGMNAGYTAQQVELEAKSVQAMGITMNESRSTVTRLIQAQISLNDASKLARIAQDAAVIGMINSSEALSRMVHGIQTGHVLILRGIGLNVNFEQSYAKLAAQLGKSTEALTQEEKMQARVNAVKEEGAKIAGVYEAAMTSAGKQLRSMERYVEDFKVVFGSTFNEALLASVVVLTGVFKDANKEIGDLSKDGTLKEWGEGITNTLALVVRGFMGTVNVIRIAGRAIATGIALAVPGGINNEYLKELEEKGPLQAGVSVVTNPIGSLGKLFNWELPTMQRQKDLLAEFGADYDKLVKGMTAFEDTVETVRRGKADEGARRAREDTTFAEGIFGFQGPQQPTKAEDAKRAKEQKKREDARKKEFEDAAKGAAEYYDKLRGQNQVSTDDYIAVLDSLANNENLSVQKRLDFQIKAQKEREKLGETELKAAIRLEEAHNKIEEEATKKWVKDQEEAGKRVLASQIKAIAQHEEYGNQDLETTRKQAYAYVESWEKAYKEEADAAVKYIKEEYKDRDEQVVQLESLQKHYTSLGQYGSQASKVVSNAIGGTVEAQRREMAGLLELHSRWSKYGFDSRAVIGSIAPSMQKGIAEMIKGHQNLGTTIVQVWKAMGDAIINEIARIATNWLLSPIKKLFEGGDIAAGWSFEGLWNKLTIGFDSVWSWVQTGWNTLTGWMGGTSEVNIVSPLRTGFDTLWSWVQTGWNTLTGWISSDSSIFSSLKVGFDSVWSWVQTGWDIAASWIRDTDLFSTLRVNFSDLWTWVSGLFSGWSNLFTSIGGAGGGGFLSGLMDTLGGWFGFGTGGQFLATKPTTITVGEQGAELINIKPISDLVSSGLVEMGGASTASVAAIPNYFDYGNVLTASSVASMASWAITALDFMSGGGLTGMFDDRETPNPTWVAFGPSGDVESGLTYAGVVNRYTQQMMPYKAYETWIGTDEGGWAPIDAGITPIFDERNVLSGWSVPESVKKAMEGNYSDTANLYRDVFGFATGGEGLFTTPTMIQVAEQGPERVKVDPVTGRMSSDKASLTIQVQGLSLLDNYSAVKLQRELRKRVGA